MSNKFTWETGDLKIVKLVYKGVEVGIPAGEFMKMSDEEKDAYVRSRKKKSKARTYSSFEAPKRFGNLDHPKHRILKDDQNFTSSTSRGHGEELKTPVQSFIDNIVFPKSLEEVLAFSEQGAYDVEKVLYNTRNEWTVPNWAKIGDVVFFMHSKTAIQTIRKLCTALKNQNEYDEDTVEWLQRWLDKGRKLYSAYGGKIFAVGQVTGNPGGFYDNDDDSPETIHWKSRIYAEIMNIWVLDKPIDISEFKQFIYISRQGAITPVYGEQYEKLKEMIISINPSPPEYFLNSVAAPVPLAKIDEANWLAVANEYRRSFLLEQQFRSFYVDRFLSVLGDQKRTYRECRIKKHGVPDSYVDNIILFNGKYLPVEVKLNVNNEADLPGQVKKYCNDDVRFIDQGVGKAFDNAKSYMNQVLIIDTEALFLYDDRSGEIEMVRSLDEITTAEDIMKLRSELIGRITA